MQFNKNQIDELEQEWRNTTHPEEKRYCYTIAAHYCQQNGQRLIKDGNKWAIAPNNK